MTVTVALLNEAFPADIAPKGSVGHMTHYVVLHITKSECSLAALSTNQNLVFSASARISIRALVILSFYVGFHGLI